MNRLDEALGRPQPTMIVTFAGTVNPDVAAEVASLGAVAELRADILDSGSLKFAVEQAKKLGEMPLIVTVRSGTEQGGWKGKESKRFARIDKLISYADGVDIELDSELLVPVIELAHEQDKPAIASHHNFKYTPESDKLEELWVHALDVDADIFKLATQITRIADYQRLAEFSQKFKGEKIITLGMGKEPIFRLGLVGLGSLATYATANKPVATGQMGYRETHQGLIYRYPTYPTPDSGQLLAA